jgi:hypothetical protein
MIVCAAADTAWFANVGPVAGLSSFSLTNSGEKIAIRNASGISVDSLYFSDAWYEGSFKSDGGWSLERIDTSFICFNASNWTASTNTAGGTPGTINSVASIFTDEEPPVPLRAFCPDPVSICIQFSEPLELLYIDSIRVEVPAGLQVQQIHSAGGDYTRILVVLDDSIPSGVPFRLLISGIWDCPGNAMPDRQEVKFGIADSALKPDVILNEVLFNPHEGGADFIELYNRGQIMADLTDYTVLSYDDETGLPDEVVEIDGDPWLLFPGEYAVLSSEPEKVAAFYTSPYPRSFPAMDDLPAMNVDAGEIGILFRGVTADRMRYAETDHFQLLTDFKGISLERIDPDRSSGDKSNWHSAAEPAGFATPGKINSQYAPGGGTSSEVAVEPEVFSPDNDGVDDVVTFRIKTPGAGYIGSIMIFHSEGRPIRELVSQQLTGADASYSWDGITDDGERAPMGLYIAVMQFFTLEGDVRQYKISVVLAADFGK